MRPSSRGSLLLSLALTGCWGDDPAVAAPGPPSSSPGGVAPTDSEDALRPPAREPAGARSLVGMTVAEAERWLADHPGEAGRVRQVRVVVSDGEPLMVTEDHRPDRLNVETADGKIVRIDGMY